MKINAVKQFVNKNISKFERDNSVRPAKIFNLYDKNNAYRGEYFYYSDYTGVKTSMSITRIMDDKLNREMQEIVYRNKDFVTLKDTESKTGAMSKVIPSEITTITTVLDFVNDKFKTIMSISKLKNELKRIGKNDPDFKYSDEFIIYEPLKEKPRYEKTTEVLNEGSISENKRNNHKWPKDYFPNGSSHQIPFRFW